MLNGLKKFTSAVIALLIAFTVVGAFARLNTYQVNADTTTTAKAVEVKLTGKARMQGYGNKNGSFSNGVLTLGKKGKGRNVYSITINFKNNTGYSGGLRYSVYLKKKGWTAWKSSGSKAGTSGTAYRIEGVKIELTGELAKHYSVMYNAYMQTFKAKQGWVSDGTVAGTPGESKRLEQLQVKLVPRQRIGEQPTVSYRMYRDKHKWASKWSKNGATAGTTSGSNQMQAGLQMSVTGSKYTGNIEYRVRGAGYSWTAWTSKNTKVGQYTKNKRLEEIQVRLTGELAEHFDVYYRTRARVKGWLGWAKNGERSGTEKYNYYLSAMQCVIVPKGSAAPAAKYNGVTSKYTSSYLINGNPVLKFADFKADHKTSKTMVGIDVSKYQGNIDFKKAKAAGVEFVILRCYVRNNYKDKSTGKYVWCNAPDKKFEANYKAAKAAGLKIGVYFFTCDYKEANMRKYTKDMINKCLKGKKIDFPVAFDWENFDYYKRAHKNNGWTTAEMNKAIDSALNKMVAVFEDELNQAGYTASIYGSKSRLEGTWAPSIKKMNEGKNHLSIWMAHWVSKSSYKGTYYMWQVNSHGRVPGISGDVDLNVAYIDRLPSPTITIKPDDGGDEDKEKAPAENSNNGEAPQTPENNDQTPVEDDKTPAEEVKPSDNNKPAEDSQPVEDPDAPEEGNATPDEASTGPKKVSGKSEKEDKASDDKAEPETKAKESPEEPVTEQPEKEPEEKAEPVKDEALAKEETPAKEEPPSNSKPAEPVKDSSEAKDAVPAKPVTPAKEQPEEAKTEEPK